jgi:hypothetical protein
MRTLVPLVLLCACASRAGVSPASVHPAAPAVQDTTLLREAARLVQGSPALLPSRNVAAEAAFVGQVRALAPRMGVRAEEVRSVDDAMRVLEAVTAQRTARILITSPRRPLTVEMRRWADRRTTIPWTRLRIDTLVQRPAVTYEFRYRPAGAGSDTTVAFACADDCDVPLP